MLPPTRPKDRYADGRESARLLCALGREALTIRQLAAKARKDFDATRALICALRRQGKVAVDRREWQRTPYKQTTVRQREVAYYRVTHAYNLRHSRAIPVMLSEDGSAA